MKFNVCVKIAPLLLLAFVSTASAVSCYSCSYTYNDDENINDPDDCATPVSGTTNEDTCLGDEQCVLDAQLNAFSSSITYTRRCGDPTSYCNDCIKTNRRSCRTCCNSDRCNSDSLSNYLTSNGLAQTCHKCEYSEIPGVRQDTSCGLSDFDATSSRVYSVLCPGMCYSAKTRIPGLNDVVRGCAYFGVGCDLDSDGKYRAGPARSAGDNVDYEGRCCMGDNCNAATAVNAALGAVILSTIVGMVCLHV